MQRHYTVRNWFKAERGASQGMAYVANPGCQKGTLNKLGNHCQIGVSAQHLYFYTTPISPPVCCSNVPVNVSQENCNSCPFKLQCMLCSSTEYLPRERSCLFNWVAKPSCSNHREMIPSPGRKSQCLTYAAPLTNSLKESLCIQWLCRELMETGVLG